MAKKKGWLSNVSKKSWICPFCNNKELQTSHHILPERFFPDNNLKIPICRKCHDKLELLIPLEKILSPQEYFKIICEFYLDHSPYYKLYILSQKTN